MSRRLVSGFGRRREHLVEIGRSLLQSTGTQDVLQDIAQGICKATGYDRAVIVQYDRSHRLLIGRAGYGVPAEDVARIQEIPEDIPVFPELQRVRGPIVFPTDRTHQAIPSVYAHLFHVTGTLIVNPLHSDRLGLLGAVFTDRSGSVFESTSQELTALQDYADLAALSFQNALLLERSRDLAALVERNRLAADLNDGVTQQLFGAEMDIAELCATKDLSEDAKLIVERLSERVSSGSHQLRKALFKLVEQDTQYDSPGMVMDAVRAHLQDFTDHCDLSTDLESYGHGPEPIGLSRDVVLRTVREGLANVAKHANGTQARVILRCGLSWWTVEVLDDGWGDPRYVRVGLARAEQVSFGLHSLANDTNNLGGRLWVSTAPQLGGMRVSVSVPVAGRVQS